MIRALVSPFAVILLLGLGRFFMKSLERPPKASAGGARFQRRLRLLGVLILLAGWVAAGSILASATRSGEPNAVAPVYDRFRDGAMITLGGRANVYVSAVREWIAGLWHGRRLAVLTGLLSLGASLLCFFLAHPLLVYPPAARNPGDTEQEGARS